MFAAGPDGVDPLRPDGLSHRWAQSRGTSTLTLLDLRHYVATAMLDAGESYRTVADILGNSEATLRPITTAEPVSRGAKQSPRWSYELGKPDTPGPQGV